MKKIKIYSLDYPKKNNKYWSWNLQYNKKIKLIMTFNKNLMTLIFNMIIFKRNINRNFLNKKKIYKKNNKNYKI